MFRKLCHRLLYTHTHIPSNLDPLTSRNQTMIFSTILGFRKVKQIVVVSIQSRLLRHSFPVSLIGFDEYITVYFVSRPILLLTFTRAVHCDFAPCTLLHLVLFTFVAPSQPAEPDKHVALVFTRVFIQVWRKRTAIWLAQPISHVNWSIDSQPTQRPQEFKHIRFTDEKTCPPPPTNYLSS